MLLCLNPSDNSWIIIADCDTVFVMLDVKSKQQLELGMTFKVHSRSPTVSLVDAAMMSVNE